MNEISNNPVRLRPICAATFPQNAEAQNGATIYGGGGRAPAVAAFDDRNSPVVEDNSKRGGDGNDENTPVDRFQLPQSTHVLLFTQPACSFPFVFSVAVVAMSFACLILAMRYNLDLVKLIKELRDTGNARNTFLEIFPIPVNIESNVRLAQYLALFVGLFMEEEIPTGVYLLRMFPRAYFKRRFPGKKYSSFVLSCAVRIVLGYVFLINIFMVLILSTGVIDMFYDFLALQFVQQLDDIAHTLSKWNAFGKSMHRACTEKYFQTDFEKETFRSNGKISLFLKAVYVFNLCWLLTGMTAVSLRQRSGYFQTDSITVEFGDEVWEEASVKMPKEYYDRWVLLRPHFRHIVSSDRYQKWTLVFSYFNGVYEKDGTRAGRPVYKERRKSTRTPYGKGLPFEYVNPAEIRYCEEISAWVFTHPFIHKKEDEVSGCNWLLRSQETEEFDLMNVDSNWKIWTGVIGETELSYARSACSVKTDCNMNGVCENGKCKCNKESDTQYLGTHCEVELKNSCQTIVGDDGNKTYSVLYGGVSVDEHGNLGTMKTYDVWQFYSRPWYVFVGGTGFSEGVSSSLVYTGSRWFGYWTSPGEFDAGEYDEYYYSEEYMIVSGLEYHAFWGREYDPMVTKFVSEPTKKDTPAGVNVYWIEKPGDDSGQYGPFGELRSLQKHNQTGRGLFRCAGEYIWPFAGRKLPYQRPIGKGRLLKP